MGDQIQPVAPTPLAPADPNARLWNGTGRRKTSVARVFMQLGNGRITVNGRPWERHFPLETWRLEATQPLRTAQLEGKVDLKILASGGGVHSQAGAARLGIARALITYNPELRPMLRREGLVTRDPRAKERKKYGQKGARKKFQWTKR